MKFKSAILTQASGSLGGITFSHNPGGLYMRARAIPTDPSSPKQNAVRNAMSIANDTWKNVLTVTNRLTWSNYAAATVLTDRLGDPFFLSGQQMYVRCNVPRIISGLAQVSAGPAVIGLGEAPAIEFATITPPEDEIDFQVGLTNWADVDGAGLIVRVSNPRPNTVNFYKGPYPNVAVFPGDSVTPITSPITVTINQEVITGQRLFAEARISYADGRYSPVTRVESFPF